MLEQLRPKSSLGSKDRGTDANYYLEVLSKSERRKELLADLFDADVVAWGRSVAEDYRNRIKSAIFSLTLKEILKDLSPKNYLVTTHLLELLKTPHEDLSF